MCDMGMPQMYFLYQGVYVPHVLVVGENYRKLNSVDFGLCQTYHQVHFESVVELEGRNIVGLLKVMNHQ